MLRLVTDPLALGPSRRHISQLVARGIAATTLLAHWLAVVLPLAYLVVLPAFASGWLGVSAVLLTVGCHAAAVVLGHPYNPAP